MNPPLYISHNGDLYEVTIEGTLVYSIRKFYEGGRLIREVGFHNLPQEVKNKIIKHVRKGIK